MGKEGQIVFLIAFVVISSVQCKSIRENQSLVNFPLEEESADEVAASGSAREALSENATATAIEEPEKNQQKPTENFETEILHQKNENKRVKRSQGGNVESVANSHETCAGNSTRTKRRHKFQVWKMQL